MTAPSSSRSASLERRASRSASPAAMIAVSGVRRSCETARSSAVLIDVASGAAPASRRPRPQRVALERRGEQRLERRHDALAQALAASRRRSSAGDQRASPPAPIADRAAAVARRSPLADARELDRRRRQAERHAPADARCDRQRRRAGSLRRAAAAPSPPPGRPPRGAAAPRAARARASSATRRRRSPRRRGTRPAPPSSRRSAIVKRPVGGMWKKLNASALATAVASPSPRPQKVETTQHGEQVDDAERDRRRRLAQREDQRRGRRDPQDGHEEAEGPPAGRVGNEEDVRAIRHLARF